MSTRPLRDRRQPRRPLALVAGGEVGYPNKPVPKRAARWPGRDLAWTARRPSREGYALAAVVLVGFGCTFADGRYQPLALFSIAVGIGAAALCVTGSSSRAHTWTWELGCLSSSAQQWLPLRVNPAGLVGPAAGGIGAVVAITARGRFQRGAGVSVGWRCQPGGGWQVFHLGARGCRRIQLHPARHLAVAPGSRPLRPQLLDHHPTSDSGPLLLPAGGVAAFDPRPSTW